MGWTAPSDRSVGELITATIWNQHAGATGNEAYLKTAIDTSTIVAATITKGTIYQNTSGHTQIVTVTADCAEGNTEIIGYVGAASPPTIQCGRVKSDSAGTGDIVAPITIVVPPSYYYEFDGDGALDAANDYVATLHG